MAKKSKAAKKTQAGDQNIPLDGREAYAKGFNAGDCPYAEDDPAFEQWNADWDAAADEASGGGNAENQPDQSGASEEDFEPAESNENAEEEGAKESRSVVKEEFRARYAEAGHPSHCGDELAVLLNNLCAGKTETDMARFEAICNANGVDLSKYNRTTKGWQGRLRMTGRNILAGKVFQQGGVVKTGGIEMAEPEYKLSAEWMASRRKVKAAA